MPASSMPSRLTVAEAGQRERQRVGAWSQLDDAVNARRRRSRRCGTFSISAGLAASTVTPGSTAPDASRTVPVRVPCASGERRQQQRGSNDNRTRLQSTHVRRSPLEFPRSVTTGGLQSTLAGYRAGATPSYASAQKQLERARQRRGSGAKTQVSGRRRSHQTPCLGPKSTPVLGRLSR